MLANGQPLSGDSIMTDSDGKIELLAEGPFWVIEAL
jgi:hypothetical protein